MTDRSLTVCRLLATVSQHLSLTQRKFSADCRPFIDQQCCPTNGVQFKIELNTKNQPSWFTFSTRLGNWSFHIGIVCMGKNIGTKIGTDVYADANTKESLRKFRTL